MAKENFLCGQCRRILCNDCKSIADEYAELLTLRTRALSAANDAVEKLTQELARARREKSEWERIAKLGYPATLTAWMDWEAARQVAEAGEDGKG